MVATSAVVGTKLHLCFLPLGLCEHGLELLDRERHRECRWPGLFGEGAVKVQIERLVDFVDGRALGFGIDFGKGRFESMVDEENIADAFGRIFGSFESAVQKKSNAAAADVSMRCPSCNASLRGRPGDTVSCPYCGSYATLPQAR